ncbi:class D sortase [Tunturiibacter lichenicola]|uniref:class D sortase n=1 Tax=Tunturiibacter lichenicola TaxID=2051959 RepID=UPI0021B20C24|nr:class D sortase [Edaphobacter lichenicola]
MRISAHAEHLLWAAGALSLGYCLVVGIQVRGSQNIAAGIGKPQQAGDLVPQNDAARADGVIGRIEIPALALSAPITSDYDVNSLRLGVGHIPGTAVPGGLGTVGLAGHRDSFFRPLRRVTPKMEIRLVDKSGTYHYVVDSTEIVSPDKVEVLDIVARPELALITCFPFDYVGSAPRRFIVHAHLLSASPDGVSAIH